MSTKRWSLEAGVGWVDTRGGDRQPSVRVLAENEAVHIHYWQTDAEMDEQGWAMNDIVCHGCNTGTRVIIRAVNEAFADTQPLWPLRVGFTHDHRKCQPLAHAPACPPLYAITETRDLR